MAVLNAVLIVGPFQNLIVIDVILFISAYVLIFISAVRLRVTDPDLKRPFRVPLGTGGMVAMVKCAHPHRRVHHLRQRDRPQYGAPRRHWVPTAGAGRRLVRNRRVLRRCSRGPVLYYVFRAIYGGPDTPSHEAGDEAIALAEAEAAEDAA